MKLPITFLSLSALSFQSSAFAPINQNVYKSLTKESASGGIMLYSQQGDNNEPVAPERLDPLIEALTKMDEETAKAPTTKLPLLGEVPVDGSLLVLAPVALIAVVGFIMSIQIGIQSKDTIVEKFDEINYSLSRPPAKVAPKIDPGACRGLCSDQGYQLDTMKGFMEGLSNNRASMLQPVKVNEPAPVVEKAPEVAFTAVEAVVENVERVEVAPEAASVEVSPEAASVVAAPETAAATDNVVETAAVSEPAQLS